MSQRVWLVSVLAVVLGGLGIAVERSSSQEASQEEGSQPQAEASGEFGGDFGRGGGFGVGEFGGGMTGEAPQSTALPAPAVPRLWVTADPGRTEELFEILKSPISSSGLDFPDNTPLAEIATYLSEEYGAPILLDTVALDELGIGADESVGISIRDVRLGQAMRLMLEPLELTYVIDGGVLLVTSEDEAFSKLTVAVYDVRDLLLNGEFDPLIEIITAAIASDSWAENGGGEAEIRAYPQRGSLVISQTTTVHEEIAAFLEAMRAAPLDPNANPLPNQRPDNRGVGAGAGCASEHEPMDRPTPSEGSVLPRRDRTRQQKFDTGSHTGNELRATNEDNPFGSF